MKDYRFSKHEADGSELEKAECVAVEVFPVFGQPATAALSQAMERSTIQRLGSTAKPVTRSDALDDLGL